MKSGKNEIFYLWYHCGKTKLNIGNGIGIQVVVYYNNNRNSNADDDKKTYRWE